MRRKICAYFYRKREKRRILYLYNKIMKQRRTLTRKMLKEAEQNIFKSRVRLKSNLILVNIFEVFYYPFTASCFISFNRDYVYRACTSIG